MGSAGQYFNSSAPDNHTVSVGGWVQGKPSVSNERQSLIRGEFLLARVSSPEYKIAVTNQRSLD